MTADALLELAGARGFRWHRFRAGQHGPELLAGVYQWADCADVLVVLDAEHAHAYRTPTGPATDVFAPTHVYWWYGDTNLVWTLRAVLTLAPPGEPSAPAHLTPVAPSDHQRSRCDGIAAAIAAMPASLGCRWSPLS